VPLTRYIRAMRAGVVLGLVAGLALSGCSSSAAQAPPRALPTPSASATPAASPTPSATATPRPTALATVPAAAQPATPQGAAAFVKFFYSQVNLAFTDGKADRIRQLSDPECGTCTAYTKSVERDASTIVGVTFDALQVEAAPVEDGIDYVTVFGRIPTRKYVKKGKTQVLPSSGAFHSTVALQRHGAYWLVRAIRAEK